MCEPGLLIVIVIFILIGRLRKDEEPKNQRLKTGPKTSAILRILFVDKSFNISREAIQVKQLFTPKALNNVARGKVSEASDALGTVTRKYECQQRKLRPIWNRLKHACMRV